MELDIVLSFFLSNLDGIGSVECIDEIKFVEEFLSV